MLLILFYLIGLTTQNLHSFSWQYYEDSLLPADGNITEDRINITVRLGQGGFQESRSPLGKLGGGQLAVDFKPEISPVALSFSSEYYTNSACPTHNYEIAGLFVMNALYQRKFMNFDRIEVFGGGGLGWIEVPRGEKYPDNYERDVAYDIEAGVNIRVFWKIGFYGIYKYLYAYKEKNNISVIDFNEHALLLGISFNFTF